MPGVAARALALHCTMTCPRAVALLQCLWGIDPLLLAPLLKHGFELLRRRGWNALQTLVNGGFPTDLPQHPPAR